MRNRTDIPNEPGKWCFGAISVLVVPQKKFTWYKFGSLKTKEPRFCLRIDSKIGISAEFVKGGIRIHFDSPEIAASLHINDSLIERFDKLVTKLTEENERRKHVELVILVKNNSVVLSIEVTLGVKTTKLTKDADMLAIADFLAKKKDDLLLYYFEQKVKYFFPNLAAA